MLLLLLLLLRQAWHADDLTDWQALAVERRIESEQRLGCDLIGGGDCVARVAVEEAIVVGARAARARVYRGGYVGHAYGLTDGQVLAVEARIEREQVGVGDRERRCDVQARVARADCVVVGAYGVRCLSV